MSATRPVICHECYEKGERLPCACVMVCVGTAKATERARIRLDVEALRKESEPGLWQGGFNEAIDAVLAALRGEQEGDEG